MKHKFLLLQKAEVVEDDDGVLTPAGMAAAHRYAASWVDEGVRNLEMERKFPQLAGMFFDIRSDAELAREHAGSKSSVRKSLDESVVMIRAEIQTVPLGVLRKAGGPYIGPRGGKWADPQFTIHWEDRDKPAARGKEEEKKEPTKTPDQPGLFPEKPAGTPVKIEHKMVPLSKKPWFEGQRTWVDHFEGLPPTTEGAYKGPDGNYVPERQRLHQEIIDTAMKDKTPVPSSQKPMAIVMMGGAASGKTTLVNREFGDKGLLQNFVMINADDVKEQLPEYDMATKDPKSTAKDAAWMVHEESSHVAKQILAKATDKGAPHNIVFDGTGASIEGYKRMIEGLKAKGYHVHLVFADVSNPDEAVGRAMRRANGTGRWVPEHIAREAHEMIPPNYEKLLSLVDSHQMFASSADNKPHQQVMSGGSGRHDIHDPNYISQFRERAKGLEALGEKRKAEKQAKKAAEAQAAGAAVPPVPGAPPQPVAKSFDVWHSKGEMKKAFPPKPTFMMREPNRPPQPGAPGSSPPAGAVPPQGMPPPSPPPAPGAPPPQAGAPMPPRPPMAPPKPPMASPMAPPRPPQAGPPPAPPVPGGTAPVPPGQSQSVGPPPQGGGDARPTSVPIEDIMQALANQQPDEEWKNHKKTPPMKDDTEPEAADKMYPHDDFMWAADAVNPMPAPTAQPGVVQTPKPMPAAPAVPAGPAKPF